MLFSMEHSGMDVQWEIGSLPLTQRMAMIRGYIMRNIAQHMTLEVPLFSVGYRYEVLSEISNFQLIGYDLPILLNVLLV